LDDGVGEDEELSDTGDNGFPVGLAVVLKAAVESDQSGVPALGCRQCSIEERSADTTATAGDMALAGTFARVVVVRSDANQGGDLLATDLAEFGQEDDEGERGAYADAIDAGDQLEPPSEIIVFAHEDLQEQEFGLAAPLQTLKVTLELLENPLGGEVLAPRLEVSDIVFQLLDEEQMLSERGQPGVWRFMQVAEIGSALGDEGGVDTIVLGTTQLVDGKGMHLTRLQESDLEAVLAQIFHDSSFVTPGGFDADAFDLTRAQPSNQLLMSVSGIGYAQPFARRIGCDIKRLLAGVDSGGFYASLIHLRRPCLAYEPGCSSNHPGHAEEPIAILLLLNPTGSGVPRSDDRRQRPGGHPAVGVPYGTTTSYNIAYARCPKGG